MQQALVEPESSSPVSPSGSGGSSGVLSATPESLLADLIREIPAEAEDSEKSQQVLEATPFLTAEADEAERVVELLDVTRPVPGAEADDGEKVAALLGPPALIPDDEA